jgi:hypothetical protein
VIFAYTAEHRRAMNHHFEEKSILDKIFAYDYNVAN